MAAAADEARVWALPTGKELLGLREVVAVAWSSDSRLLAMGQRAGGARIVDRAGAEVAVLREEAGFEVSAVAFSPNGRLLATVRYPTGRSDPTSHQLTIWDWARNKVVWKRPTASLDVAFDPAGARIAAADLNGFTSVWDVETGQKTLTLGGHNGGVLAVEYSPDGSLLATAGQDGTVRLWDAETGQRRW